MKTTLLSLTVFTAIISHSVFGQIGNEAPSITFEKTDVNCYGESSGSIISQVEGGQPPYTLTWSNGAEGEAIYNLLPGFYTLTVVDAIGTMNSRVTEIIEPEELRIIGGIFHPSSTIVEDGQITIDIEGGSPFKWEGTEYLFHWSNSAPTLDQENIGIGTYILSVSDRNGCIASESYILTASTLSTSNWGESEQSLNENSGNVVYPNPSAAGDIVTIDYDYNEAEMITILTTSGKTIKTYSSNSNGKLQVNQLEKGIYFVNFSKGNNRNETIRIIVQ